MHTIEEAKLLWCPMVRIARRETTHHDGSGDRVVVGGLNTDALGRTRVPHSCMCIADKCGMWRWDVIAVPPMGGVPGELYMMVSARAETGYCGLAGRGIA